MRERSVRLQRPFEEAEIRRIVLKGGGSTCEEYRLK